MFNDIRLSVKNQDIIVLKSIKYLGVFHDQNPTNQVEVKNILPKMA